MQPKEDIKRNINEDTAKANDAPSGAKSGWLVGIVVFLVAYLIFVLSYGHWGLVLGWLPSTVVAAAFGWLGYCFPWIGEAVVFLLEVAAIFIS
jgi:hypothetical protein